MKRLVFAFFFVWVLALAAPDTYACSCLKPEVPQAFESAAAVFVGEVTEIVAPRTDKNRAPLADRLYTIKFKVEKSWKGVSSGEVSVLSDQGRAGCFSWGPFLKGQKYVVYAERRSAAGSPLKNLAVLFKCNRTATLANASEDLKDLDVLEVKKIPAGPRRQIIRRTKFTSH